MGAKTWMLVYAEDGKASAILRSSPQLDRTARVALAKELFPNDRLETTDRDGDLSYTCPPDDEVHIGCFDGLSVIAAKEFGIDHPSKLPQRFLDAAKGRNVYLHAMHSVVDWFAYAVWVNGALQRSLSLSPDSGIEEDIGTRLAFEELYWSGQHPVGDPDDEEDDYPFPFHPLELGEAALAEFFGYQLEAMINRNLLEPETVPLIQFKRTKPWWKLW